MAQYEEIQTRKLISAYGAPGSIIETRQGALLVRPFMQWPYFDFKKNGLKLAGIHNANLIDDPRLLQRLKIRFPNIEKLIAMPINTLESNQLPDDDALKMVGAQYFPGWLFSPNTHRLDRATRWAERWRANVDDKQAKNVFPLHCIDSYVKPDKRKKLIELEQVRFILISSSGRMCDIPWDRWVWTKIGKTSAEKSVHELETAKPETPDLDETESKGNKLDWSIVIPDDVIYKYKTDGQFGNLSGTRIEVYTKATDTEPEKYRESRSLAGLFNLNISEYELYKGGLLPAYDYEARVKVVLRSSNSVYYPNIISSLFLPTPQGPLFGADEIKTIKKKAERGRTPAMIAEDLADDYQLKRAPADIKALIDNGFVQPSVEPVVFEEAYRQGEFDFITAKTNGYDSPALVIKPVRPAFYQEAVPGKFKAVFAVRKLKLTSVQTSFTRQEPIDRDYYLQKDEATGPSGTVIKKQYTHGWRPDSVKRFPAIESYGEGLFFQFDEAALTTWAKKPGVSDRIAMLQKNLDDQQNQQTGLVRRVISPAFVLIHTFSHLLIKELEFLCGYPASSLQERLYVGKAMNGLLIYTIAGSEGSYGGLVSLAESDKLAKLLQSALWRATDCAADPICHNTDENGQGVGGTNLAACFACALLPETSCEEFNRFLDRQLVIDQNAGFFYPNAATPGSTFPSMYSSKAPPPVET